MDWRGLKRWEGPITLGGTSVIFNGKNCSDKNQTKNIELMHYILSDKRNTNLYQIPVSPIRIKLHGRNRMLLYL